MPTTTTKQPDPPPTTSTDSSTNNNNNNHPSIMNDTDSAIEDFSCIEAIAAAEVYNDTDIAIDNNNKVYRGYDIDTTEKFSSDDEVPLHLQQPSPPPPTTTNISSGTSAASSFIRNSLRRLSTAASFSHGDHNNNINNGTLDYNTPYDHRNSLIRSITTTAAATLERRYSVAELVQTLNHTNPTSSSSTTTNTNPELERRVLDFQLAQKKRYEKYGRRNTFGIFGMYNHLANVRIDLEWAEDAAYRRLHNEPYLSWTDFDDARLKTLSKPYFTYIIVFLCTIMLLVEFAVNDWKIEPLSNNPMIGPSKETLIILGARDTELIVNNNEWYRIVTPMVLHAGIIHYIVNMAAVWFIGIAIEQNHGWMKSFILFMIPGIGGTILSAIFLPQYISVGASGGIFGLVGGCIADLILHWNLLFIRVLDETPKQARLRNFYAISILMFEILFNIIIGLITPFIDNFSHLGGMVYGICCAFTTIEAFSASGFFGGIKTSTFDKIRTVTIKFCGLIISIALIMVTTVWLATTPDATQSPCSGCRYFSCVPFPFFTDDKWWYCDDCDFVTGILTKNGEYYETIELTCPDDTLETINIGDELLSELNDVSKRLPTYCRDNCNDVFN